MKDMEDLSFLSVVSSRSPISGKSLLDSMSLPGLDNSIGLSFGDNMSHSALQLQGLLEDEEESNLTVSNPAHNSAPYFDFNDNGYLIENTDKSYPVAVHETSSFSHNRSVPVRYRHDPNDAEKVYDMFKVDSVCPRIVPVRK